MHTQANGTRLWFDVDGAALVPDGPEMRQRPTVVMLHGGPGFDHSLYKEDFWRLTDMAQVVYLDQRNHGRSARDDTECSLAVWADDVRAFCDALGIDQPIVLGHSFGSFVAARYASRYPDHPAGLVLQSTWARRDLDRIAEGFRRAGGDDAADLARRFFGGDGSVIDAFVAHNLPLYGPWVPGEEQMARTIMNEELLRKGSEILAEIDVTDDLEQIICPTLICVGDRDPLTQVADAHEVAAAIPHDRVRLEEFADAGHFIWKDVPDVYWPTLHEFLTDTAAQP